MKNYKPFLNDITETELRKSAEEAAEKITYRLSSMDETRKSTEYEKQVLSRVIYGTLLSIRWTDDCAFAALNTGEFIIDLLLPNINGYDSFYLPTRRILETYANLPREKDAETADNYTSDCDSHVPWSERVYHAYLDNGGGETQFGS